MFLQSDADSDVSGRDHVADVAGDRVMHGQDAALDVLARKHVRKQQPNCKDCLYVFVGLIVAFTITTTFFFKSSVSNAILCPRRLLIYFLLFVKVDM